MTYERWQNLTQMVKDKFKVVGEGKEELDPGPGYVEFIECETPTGKVRVELVVRPLVAEKKFIYSKRAGTSASVEYKYDPKEHTLTLHAFKWDEASNNWEEIKNGPFVSSF